MPNAAAKKTPDTQRKPPVDKGVRKPICQRAPRQDSTAAKLRELEVGETESRSVRLPGEGAVASVISQVQEDMRNSFAAIIRNAKARLPGAEFAVAGGEFRARDGDVIVTVAVTRTA